MDISKKTSYSFLLITVLITIIILGWYLISFDNMSSFSDKGGHNVDKNSIITLNSQQTVQELLDSVDYVLADCDGVLYVQSDPVPGAASVLNRFRAKGKKVLFVSNTSTRSRVAVLNSLKKMGFQAELDEVLVSTYLVAVYLRAKNFTRTAYVLGCDGLLDELNLAGIKFIGPGREPFPLQEEVGGTGLLPPVTFDPDVGAAIIGYDKYVSLAKIVKACSYGSMVDPDLFIATNPDEIFPTSQPGLVVPGAGPFVELVKSAIHREPVVMGKPSHFFWEAINSAFPEIDARRTLMIGDKLDTDIAFANGVGLKASLLVGTGNVSLEMADEASQKNIKMKPTHFSGSLGDLEQFL